MSGEVHIEKLLSSLREALGRCKDLKVAYLFGSAARGELTASSDLDIAVLFERPPDRQLHSVDRLLAMNLESDLGRRVDLISLGDASPDLIHRVLRDGQLILDRDPSARVAFETRARREYFDILPLLRSYRRTVLHEAGAEEHHSSSNGGRERS